MLIDRRLLPLSSLRAFESAGHHLHMGRAGEALGVTHGAISHQIRLLEDRLGLRLFFRERGRLKLTQAGEILLTGVQKGFDQITSSVSAIDPRKLSGTLKIGCTQTIGMSWALRSIMDFQFRYPETKLHVIELKIRQNEIPMDIDVAICYGKPKVRNRRLLKLATPEIFPVCNPSLLYGKDRISKPSQLVHYPLLHDNQQKWPDWFSEMKVKVPEKTRDTFFTSTSLTLKAAKEGYGIALGNPFEIQEDLKDGKLVVAIDRSISEPYSYYLLGCHPEEQSLIVKLLEDNIKDTISNYLD